MRAITEESVMSWTPDMSARSGWSEVRQSHSKTEMGRASDLRDMSNQVFIVRIVNFYDEVIYSARVAGNDELVQKVADEMLNTFCRRFPGTPLKHRCQRFVEKD